MPMTNVNTGALTALDVATLVVQPVVAQSTALQAVTIFRSAQAETRVPIVSADPGADWLAEAQPIPATDPEVSEEVVRPAKIAGLTIISREQAEDSSPDAQRLVGEGLVRSIVARVDESFWGAVRPAPAPAGILSVTGISVVEAPALWGDLNPFDEALAAAADVGAQIDTWVTGAADGLALALLKESDGSRRGLLGSDPTQPTVRQIAGVPLVIDRHIAPGVVWGIPRDRVVGVLRRDATVDVSTEAAFDRDAVAVRATLRVGWAFPHPEALVKIVRDA